MLGVFLISVEHSSHMVVVERARKVVWSRNSITSPTCVHRAGDAVLVIRLSGQ